MTTLHDVALLRLAAQRLIGPGSPTAAETVRWMTATQAQDHTGALTSVALRTSAATRADVEAALDAGAIVKCWPMRGTLHLVAAEDLPWMLALLAPRVVASSTARRAGLGLTEPQLEQARDLTLTALAGGRRLRRADLLTVYNDAGLSTSGQRGVHILRFLAMTGTLVFGPTRDGEQLLVRTDEWITRPRHLHHDQALGELALRYFRSHGPATVADFTRWANLIAADVRTGLALARPKLTSLHLDRTEHLMDPRTPDLLNMARAQAEGVLLLPGFDELLLGYNDRRAQLDPAFAERIVPGGNGVFRPTVLSAGRVVGTWTRTGRSGQQTITATPLTTFQPEVAAVIPRRYAALRGREHDTRAEPRVSSQRSLGAALNADRAK